MDTKSATLAKLLRDWKDNQDKMKEFLGDEYTQSPLDPASLVRQLQEQPDFASALAQLLSGNTV